MGLTADTPIVTTDQVSNITHEGLIANYDQGAGTLAALCAEATNAIIRAVKKRGGVAPSEVTNTDELRAAAAYWVMWTLFSSQPQGDDEIVRKTELYRQKWENEIATVVLESAAVVDEHAPRGLPKSINFDAVPFISNGNDNRRTSSDAVGPFYTTR